MLTKLDVVNDQLATMGEAPITEAGLAVHPLAGVGLRRLAEASTAVQNEGWWFNTLTADLTPDASGIVEFPCGVLRVEGRGTDGFAIRGDKLYDFRAEAIRTQQVVGAKVIVELDFLDLPPSAQFHIRDVAVLAFQRDYDSTESRRALWSTAARDSLIRMTAEHTRTVRANRLLMPSTLASILAASGRLRRGLPVRGGH